MTNRKLITDEIVRITQRSKLRDQEFKTAGRTRIGEIRNNNYCND